MRKSEEKHEAYVSCIKINGVPILPPLITPAKLKEIRRYKKQAVKVERRIEREKAWKDYVDSFCESRNAFSQTSFGSGHIEDHPTQSEAAENDESEHSSVSKVQSPLRNLTCNIQASEYINNKFVIFNSSPGEKEQSAKLNIETPKTSLIRSNSYILETPSPVLVEHLKKTKVAEEQPLVLEDVNTSKCSDSLYANSLYCDVSDTETELKFISDNESQSQVSEKEYHLKQFIDNNVPTGQTDFMLADDVLSKVIAEQTDASLNVDAAVVNDTFGALKDVLKEIPEEYGKQILKILEKQNVERDIRIETYNKLQNELNSQHNKSDVYLIHDNDVDEVEKQCNEITVQSRGTERSSKRHKYGPKEERAASIIGAFVKGYLTRRLMQTAKVQNLIQIIKDALLCAVQLHSESLENIEESDVELHRRLIQQVSAACYAFHDVFFTLPIQEQMSIIAADRQIKLEKLLRPSSSSSLISKQTPRRSLRSTASLRSTTSV